MTLHLSDADQPDTGSVVTLPVQTGAPGPEVIPGNFDAHQAPDGTWTIRDVPVFAEVPKGERGNAFEIDHEWMLMAVKRDRDRFALDGYIPPIAIRHHHRGDVTEYAGRYKLTSVRKITYLGQPIHAIFADLVAIPDPIFQRIKRGELAYRSVEIADWRNTEVGSLSLLPDEAPFFKFALLTIRKEHAALGTEPAAVTQRFDATRNAALAFCGIENAGAFLFSFSGGYQMAADEPKVEDKDKLAEAIPAPDEKKLADGPSDSPGVGKLLKYMEAFCKHFKISMGDEEKPEEKAAEEAPPVEQPKMEEGEEKEEKGKPFTAESNIQFAAMAGKLTALEGKVEAREKRDRVDGMVASAREKLRGYALTASVEKNIRIFAEAGQKALDAYVENHKAVAVKDPPATMEEGTVDAKNIPSDLAEFASQGPDVLEKAMQFAEMHAAMAGRSGLSLKDFVKTQFELEAGTAFTFQRS